ncbi:MAG TPA: BON domain-containing protein [Candidatus Acidoferrales bacterium]|nr:BON domain-containing protein [Candidatus Acidoferrales bacterium]
MNKLNAAKVSACCLVLGCVGMGCSTSPMKSPDVADRVRKDLDQANFKDVSVSQDRDKGVITLTGHVASDSDKGQAEGIAKADAGGQVVADEIAVKPPNDDNAGKLNSDLDSGIEKNLDAALIQSRLDKDVKYDVKNGVVTLKGNVGSQSTRGRAESVASKVPNVHQVVNELDVKVQKATSTQ